MAEPARMNMMSLRAGQAPSRLLCLVVILVFSFFVTNLDIFLTVRGFYQNNGLFLFLLAGGVLLTALLVEGIFPVFLDRFAEAIVACVLPITLLAGWVALHAFNAGRPALVGEVDFTTVFPIYQFLVLLFGVALACATEGSNTVRQAAFVTSLVLGASVIWETLVPGALGSTDARTGGIALNANIAAFILSTLLAVSLDFKRGRLTDVLLIFFVALAVASTLSRMGLVYVTLVLIAYVGSFSWRELNNRRPDRAIAGVLMFAAIVACFVGFLFLLVQFGDSQNAEFQERIEKLLFGGTSIGQDPYRGYLLEHYVRLATQQPFWGFGSGYTFANAVVNAPYGLGPHNMYVRVWVDTGLPGLFAYAAFVASLLVIGIQRKSLPLVLVGLLTIAYGFFSHNVIDNKAVLILIGVAVGKPDLNVRRRR